MTNVRSLALAVLAAALVVGVAPAWAQQERSGSQQQAPSPPRSDRRAPPEAGSRDRQRSMSESVRWAQKTAGGQVLGAERVQSDGRDFNRVKLLDGDGRVRYMDDVPQSRGQSPAPRPEARKSPGP